MERRFSLLEAHGASFTKIRQAAFMYCVPDLVRPLTDHRPETSRREAAAPLPAESTETLLFGRRLDGAPELEAALLGAAGARPVHGARPRDYRKVFGEVAAHETWKVPHDVGLDNTLAAQPREGCPEVATAARINSVRDLERRALPFGKKTRYAKEGPQGPEAVASKPAPLLGSKGVADLDSFGS